MNKPSPESFDAVIVGGGPAGSTLAWKMTSSGRRVLILDQARFPRVKLCGGWITPPVLEALQLDVQEYRKNRVFQEFTGFSVRRMSRPATNARYPEPISYGIIRSQFDHYLLARCGASVAEGERVESIQRKKDHWLINSRWSAPLLIGAGGHYCPVARFLGVRLRGEKSLSTLELELELGDAELADYRLDPQLPEVHYFDDIRGYGWCFLKERFLNIGIGRTQNRHLKDFLNNFLQHLKEEGKIPAESRFLPSLFRGHAYKLHFVTPRPFYSDGVLLIGDSAGLSFNYSGEGIRPAVESSLLAWSVLKENGSDFSRERLAPYAQLLGRQFGQPVTGWRFRLMEALPPVLFQVAGRAVFSSSYLKRRLFLERLFLRRSSRKEPRPIEYEPEFKPSL